METESNMDAADEAVATTSRDSAQNDALARCDDDDTSASPRFTANLAGLPGISVPVAQDKTGLPLGLQVIGKALDEAACFRVGAELETASGYNAKPEAWWK